MSDYDANRSDATNNDTLDDTTGTADKSIIGRVKSRVSNILPNSLYKWLLPSNETSDSINGNVSEGLSGFSSARRRRRIELEEDDDDDDGEEEDAEEEEEEDEDATAEQQQIRIDYINLSHHQNTNTDEESNNSEEEATTTTTARATVLTKITGRRTVNATVHEPPTKRSRYTLDLSTTRNNILTPRQPLLSSTPTALNNSKGNMSKVAMLKGERHEKESPLCNFNANAISSGEKVPNYETSPKGTGTQSAALSSRRSLNITPRSYVDRESHGGLTNLRRQNLNSVSGEMPSTSYGASHGRNVLTPKSNTHVVEVVREEREPKSDEELNAEQEQTYDSTKYNGRSNSFIEKQQRLLNGSGRSAEPAVVPRNPENLRDSSVSSSEGVGNGTAESVASMSGNVNTQRKTGLFNMSSTNSKNGSRTSSFGNGLNFYSHLEGRKSLFSEAQSVKSVNAINNSTLSLTSLNRRQFNASIYGSTSALSDSRLLNTFSPFYNGRTTYGGAAAYNKYATGGPQSVRITPTLIRPISSLSTLSSSSNSLAFAGATSGGVENSAISSTAKRILDIINDFPTPLSEAKKMASNLKLNQQQQQQLLPQSKSRLNDSYLEQARSMRLSQVRTPYARPTVTLTSKPAHVNGQAGASQLPPVRELQVPSMSQLLQMKKLQSTTERSRQIAKQNNVNTTQKVHNTEYTLPIAVEKSKVAAGKDKQLQEHEQKHTSKMKQKVTTTAHTSKKHQDDDAPPPAVNLPNVAFPLMKSMPKFNITLPNMPTSLKSTSTPISTSVVSTAGPATAAVPAVPSGKFNLSAADTNAAFSSGSTKLESKSSSVIFNSVGNDASKTDSASSGNAKSNKDMQSATKSSPTTFKFSNPVIVKDSNELNRTVLRFNGEFKFSPPTLVSADASKEIATLKSGSCLDALKKPFVLPTSTVSTVPTTPPKKEVEGTIPSGFGAQFKKAAGEWECEACMLRNKSDATKCVACETPHKSPSAPSLSSMPTDLAKAPLISNSFGSQFKKSANEWECDACMVRNKTEDEKCVACETPRKGAKDSNATSSSMPMPMPMSTATMSNVTPIKSSFGDAFKPKEGVWTCSTCLIQNQSSAIECVACQAKKPGVTSSTTAPVNQFKFGLKPTSNTDAGFKAIAAEQKASKWECEACMTRNDASRQKCVCCDQAKPGSQMPSETAPKFSFGSTASSKFSFGFGAANVQPTSSQTEAASTTITSTTTATTSTSVSSDAPAKTGFVFGSVSSSEPKQTQSATGITFGFKPVSKSDADAVVSTSSTTTTTTTVSKGGFVFGSGSTTEKSVNDVASSTPSVKFSLPTTTAIKSTETVDSASKLTTAPSVTFGFGSSAAPTSTTANKPSGGFSFGTPPKPVADTSKTVVSKESNALGGFTFKAPTATAVPESQPKSFSFGAVATTASVNTTPAAAVKPIFSFGASTTNTPSASASASASAIGTTSDAAPVSSTVAPTIAPAPTTSTSTNTFNFGGNTNTVAKTHFGATPASTAPISGNVFGSFGNAAAPAASIFGSESKPVSTQATATPSTNVFGSFGGQNAGTKPTASATPLFGGNVAGSSSSTTASAAAASGPFVFGAAASMKSPGNATTGVSAVPTTSTTSAWSQNTFSFGSAATTAPAVGTSDAANKSVFGAFASPQTNNNNAVSSGGSSIFGSISAGAKAPNTQGFGSNANNSTSIFGSSTTMTPNPAPPGASTSIFGASSVGAGTSAFGAAPTVFNSGNNATSNAAPTFGSAATQAAPAFGSAPTPAAPAFGSAPTPAAPAFGSAPPAAAPTTFGAFGSGGATAPTVSNTDGASAAKKQELAYNFGSTPAQNATSGFNFSTAAGTAKPAFNFGSTAQPAFNFTGSTEAQTTKPFQFGATTSAPVFNFGGGAVEATSNAPFQFSSGAASASSNNIFAPNPTNAQSAQVARRKIRAPIRRMTPR